MANVISVKKKDGASYDVDTSGATNIEVPYQVVLSAPLDCASELLTSFSGDNVAIPAIGAAHPDRAGYSVSKYRIKQPKGAAKNTLDVTVIYEPTLTTTETEGEGEEEVEIESVIEEWGWDDSTSERELVNDVNGEPVVNSAGDPFDTVPTVQVPSPVFTKVMKCAVRRSFSQYMCKINSAAVTIGNVTCDAYTLLATISEKKNIGDSEYPYTYTVRLRYRSNLVTLEDSTTPTEIGWNVALVDKGMREIDVETGFLKIIQTISKETGEAVAVTSPELLDGEGHAIGRSASGSAAVPYVFERPAYLTATFPSWFYSES